ncbi:HDOD domain-containing protein [Clostridium estertheticum]|uniref:HDOD domain-containing protein n=1 Tax=Clostridium estertheticum TaxID=238834 RepID=A0AA47EJ87_9CLOT|nr:HDOD domain-containing protein [Clostridium estertheticum]MBU3155582.1 HDOD domain-containing protein [Clostridium estertheticum]MBU3198105.1 HDOD domain-containing protein [Clostridium estertheticum]WAG60021.1 HDOD domain-containing protein [Clostridium estertheticum]WAG65899.1 HDOD domain-containing protein [Clostridium estertheticum]
MDVFLARQPILDKFNKLLGYELLFRDSGKNIYQAEDGDKATVEVIKNCFVNIGIQEVTGGKKAFINFTENILKSDIFMVLPPETVIIEILENIEPTEEIVELCTNLKKQGYLIALDDFVYSRKYIKLIEVADIIKVDFKITKGHDRKKVIEQVNSTHVCFIAEKVETMEEFHEAVSFGYSYFQGYYFSRPLIVSGKRISENKIVYMKLLKEINSGSFDIDKIEELIKKDVSLSFKLLRLINSANYVFRSKIKSIKQALTLLGEKEIKKWLYLIVFKTMGADKAEIIVIESLTRARFSELILCKINKGANSFNAYIIGLFSMVDLLLDVPLEQILEELLLPIEVKGALDGSCNNEYRKLLDLIINYEEGKWDEVSKISKQLKLDEKWLPEAYYEAIFYANE